MKVSVVILYKTGKSFTIGPTKALTLSINQALYFDNNTLHFRAKFSLKFPSLSFYLFQQDHAAGFESQFLVVQKPGAVVSQTHLGFQC